MVEGKPTFYASAINTGNTVEGILVETYEGRPTKIEGNPDHPISQGATSMFAQGDIYNLYDPDRIQTPSQNGVSKSTDEFKQWVKSLNLNRRSKIGILIDRLPSPTFHQALREVKGKFPNSTIAEFSSYNTDKSEEGIRSLSGQSLTPNYQFDKAKTVVSIEADFLNANIYGAHYSKAFSKRRDVENAKHLNRLYVVEDTYTITGGAADHRIKLNTQNADLFLALLTSKLIDENPSKARLFYTSTYIRAIQNLAKQYQSTVDPVYIDAIADDLINSQKQSIIIAGNTQSAHVHAMTALLNLLLGNINNTVTYHSRVVDDYSNNLDTFLTQLTNDEFDAVLVLSYNPSYTLTSTQFDTAFKKFKKYGLSCFNC